MLTTLLHSRIIAKATNTAKLYYLCRGLDKSGCGWVMLTRDDVIEKLGISRSTFVRYCQDRNLFRDVIYDKSIQAYTFYYHSLANVCINYDCDSLGGIISVDLDELKSKDFVKQATLVEALLLQQVSAYIANKTKDEYKCTNIIDIDQLFREVKKVRFRRVESCVNGSRATLISFNHLFLGSDSSYAVFGASLDGIAKRTGKSSRTVCRHLRTSSKIHQCISRPHYEQYYAFGFMDDSDIYDESQQYFKKTLPNGKLDTFKSYCNLYETVYDLEPKRYTRSRVKYKVMRHRELLDGGTFEERYKLYRRLRSESCKRIDVKQNVLANPDVQMSEKIYNIYNKNINNNIERSQWSELGFQGDFCEMGEEEPNKVDTFDTDLTLDLSLN